MSDSGSVQMSLAGDEAERGRIPPDTFAQCSTCGETILRSRRREHEEENDHSFEPAHNINRQSLTVEEEDEPEEVGAKYSVRENFTVEYETTVYAVSEHQAKQKAKEQRSANNPSPTDRMAVHTNVDKRETIYEDDEEAEEHDLLP